MRRYAWILFPFALGCPQQGDDNFAAIDGPDDGVRLEAYSSAIGVDAPGPRRVDLVAGELPPGLEMDASGAIEGTPAMAGVFAFSVLVSGMRRYDDTPADLEIFVALSPDDEGAFLAPGIEPGSLYDPFSLYPLQDNVWMRVDEAGVDEHVFEAHVGLYLPGPNDRPERGLNDDELIGTLPPSAVDWSFDDWVATEEDRVDPPGYPNAHTPDGNPPVLDPEAGTITAGSDTGDATLTMSAGDFPGTTASYTVQVVPPDWCPNGLSSGAGQGACE